MKTLIGFEEIEDKIITLPSRAEGSFGQGCCCFVWGGNETCE